MSVCSRCIMPDSYPGVSIDSEGICSLCRIHDESPRLDRPVAGSDALLTMLTSKPSGEYQCLVPLSGGKDSSYALYYVVRKLGLKPLAVFEDSGFVSQSAKDNIKNICEILSVDLVVHRARFRRRLVREALLIWKHSGRYFSACPPCETNNRSVAIREAMRRGIPFIVWGASDYEDDDITFLDPDSSSARQRFAGGAAAERMTLRKVVSRLLTLTGLSVIYQQLKLRIPWQRKARASYHAAKYAYYSVRNNLDVDVPEGWRKFSPFVQTSFENKPVETIYIFDYLPYDPRAFVATLRSEVGWRSPEDREARMDCRLHALWAYQTLKETGITVDGFTSSVLVRYGLLTRVEAERKEQALKSTLLGDCETLLEELGIDREGILG